MWTLIIQTIVNVVIDFILKLLSEFKVGDVKLTVEQGDILSKNCDAIVNGCSDNFDFNGMMAWIALKNKIKII